MGRSRRWKLPACLLAGILLSVLALVWDAQARAERVLDRHLERVAEDIDTLREERESRGSLLDEWAPARRAVERILAAVSRTDPRLGSLLECCPFEVKELQDLIRWRDEGIQYPFEDALPAWDSPFETRHQTLHGHLGNSTLEDMVLRTVLAQEIPSTGGMEVALRRVAWERDNDHAWRCLLQKPGLSRERLRDAARVLERLERERTPIKPFIMAEHVFQRNAVLRFPRRVWGRNEFIKEGPGWREIYSWPIFLARILADHERYYGILDELGSLPLDQQWDETEGWYDESAWNTRWATPLRYPGRELLGYERWAQQRRILRSLTIAIKRYALEYTHLPPSLEDLVPEYVAELPRDNELRYSQGTVRIKEMPGWRSE